MVRTLTAQVLVSSSYANAEEVSYYRVNGSDASLVGANYALTDFNNGYCVRASEAAFVDPRPPVSGGTAPYAWGFPGANEWVDHYTFPFDFNDWTLISTPDVTSSLPDPFGGNNANIVTDNRTDAFEYVRWSGDIPMRRGQKIRVSLYVGKENDEGSFPEIQIRDQSSQTIYAIDINKNTGADVLRVNTGWTTGSHTVTSYNDEWWKIQADLVNNVTESIRVLLYPAVGTVLGSTSAAATGSTKFYLDTVETDNAYKDVNQSRIFSDGGVLIEDEQVNINTYSQDLEGADWSDILTVTLNSDAEEGPDGFLADSLTTSVDRAGRRKLAVAVTTGSTHTYTAYAKSISGDGIVKLERAAGAGITAYDFTAGNEWGRFGSSWTPTTASINYGVQADNANAKTVAWSSVQLEEGPFQTSIIRTFGTAVTRSADFVRVPNKHLSEEFLSGHFKIQFVFSHDATAETAGSTTYFVFGFDGVGSQGMRFRSTGAQWQVYCVNDTGTMTFILSGGGFDRWSAGELLEFEANHRTGFFAFRNLSRGTEFSDTDVAAAGGSFSTTADLFVGAGNTGVQMFHGVVFPPVAVID